MSIADIILEKIIKTSNNNITITDEKGIILYTNSDHWSVYDEEPKTILENLFLNFRNRGCLLLLLQP